MELFSFYSQPPVFMTWLLQANHRAKGFTCLIYLFCCGLHRLRGFVNLYWILEWDGFKHVYLDLLTLHMKLFRAD